jgi:hypothetical protein
LVTLNHTVTVSVILGCRGELTIRIEDCVTAVVFETGNKTASFRAGSGE